MKGKSKALQTSKSRENSHHQTSSSANAKASSLDRKHRKRFINSNPKQQNKWQRDHQSVSSVTQSCPSLCDPMNRSTPGLPVRHQLPEFTQTLVHRVSDATQPSHPLSSPFPPAPKPSQHQGLFQRVNSLHEVAKVLEFQLQHQSFQ